ncbi:uncharacterized protein LOC105423519 [Pogonomyrmex barbatus]|uniref:Uncharacterized protein LOC105423519 n=1 Tax=Pogonomyrmex barbatus TaxID=144034 RepID=A0A6I9VUA5_9HYME|nr:uncharacterized protein LOC105423519 [Pogonomyrmex barbatus]
MGGHMNSKVGDGNILPEDFVLESNFTEKRSVSDMQVYKNGKILLEFIKNIDFFIMNGRSLFDINGNFTYIGDFGCSTVDFVLDNLSNILFLMTFWRRNYDHLPIYCNFFLNNSYENCISQTQTSVSKKYLWDDGKKKQNLLHS